MPLPRWGGGAVSGREGPISSEREPGIYSAGVAAKLGLWMRDRTPRAGRTGKRGRQARRWACDLPDRAADEVKKAVGAPSAKQDRTLF